MNDERMASQVVQGEEKQHAGSGEVRVTVDYLPATQPFHSDYPGTTTLEVVRLAAMAFFGVRDRQEPDTYAYLLEFAVSRVTNTGQALDQLLGAQRRGAEFHLVEQITPGDRAR